MFWHNFKNCMRVTVKGKITLFWTLLFPILLATFMHAAFRNISKDKMFKNIDVAVVSSGNEENELMYVLELLADGDDSLLNIHKMTEEEAGKALDDEEVKGIIFTDDISLVVKKSSVNASILESILKNYKQNEYALKDIIGNMESAPNEMQINAIMADIMSDVSYYTESSTSSGNQDNITNYFYAIFAMSCLFAGFTAVGEINNLQANISARGMRRCISPNSKIVFILSEFAAMILIQFLAEIIAFIYMNIIGVDFGNKYPAIIITLFFGCMIGLAIGIIVGAISRLKEDA
ncbi:MAG: ABC transporter permease, partial [Coprococcus sp.]